MAFGSDSPVIDSNPWPGIYSAITGRTGSSRQFPQSGEVLNPSDERCGGFTLAQALSAYTLAGAKAEGMARRKGMIGSGLLADLSLLDRPMEELETHEIPGVKSRLTIVGGRTAWREEET